MGAVGVRRYDITEQDRIKAFEAEAGFIDRAAARLKIEPNALRSWLKRMKRDGKYDFEAVRARFRGASRAREFDSPELPEDDVPVEELVDRRVEQFERLRAHEQAAKLIQVRVHIPGPIGILHFGDPHLDDDGADIGALRSHCELVQATPGLFAACVGDVTNNWVGRLARLYAEQSTSSKQAWRLAEWFISSLKGKLLYLVGGNHDGWSGAGDPLRWITRQIDAMYRMAHCRIELQLPEGQRPRINTRHDFPGHSMWNVAHGPARGLVRGVRDHVAICGDKHVSGHNELKDPDSGMVMHAIRVATYKIFDRFAREKGFEDQNFSPCAVTVFNTLLDERHADYVKLFWDPLEGSQYLTYLRNRHAPHSHPARRARRRVRRTAAQG